MAFDRIYDTYNLAVWRGRASDLALAEHPRDGSERLNLEEALDLVLWLSVAGVADTEPVIGEGMVSGVEGCVDVGVVVGIVRKVPVCLVKADTVGEDLQWRKGGWLLRRGHTELARDVVGTRHSSIAGQRHSST